MAEDLIREIHTQLDLITNDLAALPRGLHCVVSQNHLRPAAAFSQRDQRHDIHSKSIL